MKLFCDVRKCFRKGRFAVEGTIWHTCRLHHPTSPYRSPTVEQVHSDWQECHPEFQLVQIGGCEVSEPRPLIFGFGPSKEEAEQDDD